MKYYGMSTVDVRCFVVKPTEFIHQHVCHLIARSHYYHICFCMEQSRYNVAYCIFYMSFFRIKYNENIHQGHKGAPFLTSRGNNGEITFPTRCYGRSLVPRQIKCFILQPPTVSQYFYHTNLLIQSSHSFWPKQIRPNGFVWVLDSLTCRPPIHEA